MDAENRYDAQVEAAAEALRRAMGLPPLTKEEREQSRARAERETRANKHADVCAACGRALLAYEVVYRIKQPTCRDCTAKHPRYRELVEQEPVPCEGCGRPVVDSWLWRRLVNIWALNGGLILETDDYVLLQHTKRHYHTWCSTRCAGRVYNRVPRVERTCAVCGKLFTGKRADTRTCSAACRQKAYRQRHS